jgi:hypothetical protein
VASRTVCVGQNSANFRMMWARNKTSKCKSCLQHTQPTDSAFPVRFTAHQRSTARKLAKENWETWRSQRRRVEAVQARRAAVKHADRVRVQEDRRLREEAVRVLHLRGVVWWTMTDQNASDLCLPQTTCKCNRGTLL